MFYKTISSALHNIKNTERRNLSIMNKAYKYRIYPKDVIAHIMMEATIIFTGPLRQAFMKMKSKNSKLKFTIMPSHKRILINTPTVLETLFVKFTVGRSSDYDNSKNN